MEHNRKIVYLAGFIFSIAIAFTSYINSSLLENYISKNYVGLVYVIASILTILGLLKMPEILNKIGNRKTIILFSAIIFFALILLSVGKTGVIVIPAFILYFISISFVIASIDSFLEDFSKKGETGTLRGTYLMIVNSAWILSQVISGSVINKSSLSGIYLLSAFFIFLLIFIFLKLLKNFKDPEYVKVPIWQTFKTFLKNKHLSKIYLSNLVLQFFYAWMVIYTPLYLHQNIGLTWDKIGIIFGIMLIPFVLLDYPLGKLSDKIGEKKLLIAGFFIIALSTFIIPFISEPAILIWALVLFLTRIGAATIEVMSESYFFKTINEKRADEISFFRNASAVAYVIAPITAFPILMYAPSFKFIFFVLSAILLIGFFVSLKLRDVK